MSRIQDAYISAFQSFPAIEPHSPPPLAKTILLHMTALITLRRHIIKFPANPATVDRPAARTDLDGLVLRVYVNLVARQLAELAESLALNRNLVPQVATPNTSSP